ncbi:hypothetical protein R5M92_04185 [Halomonas sp. Bachu 37]|uniref:hypothetical protein n=1 Tax=Halomonas kashgarensis TaxID=3084920 RepID=UPI003216B050
MAKLLEQEQGYVDAARGALLEQLPHVGTLAYVAFVVWLPDSDEFLCQIQSGKDATAYKWVMGRPELARRFPRLKRARAIADEKEGATVAILFETDRQFMVSAIEAD